MAVRIYTLAKDLKVDSKDLVDLCKKAGITGKGSALASLTDEEAQKVTDYVRGSGSSSASAPPAARASAPIAARDPVASAVPVAAVRESMPIGSPKRSIRTPLAAVRPNRDVAPATQEPTPVPIESSRSQPVASETVAKKTSTPIPASSSDAKPGVAARSREAEPAATPINRDKPSSPSRSESPAGRTTPPASKPVSFASRDRSIPNEPVGPVRRDPVGPSAGGKIRVLGRGGRGDEAPQSSASARGTKRRDPVINLAAIPESVGPGPKIGRAHV